MEPVRNPRFLTKDNKGYKLRRRVPDDLLKLVGKTAWVKRLGGLPHKEACEQADTFAVWTSAEIKKLRGLLGASPAKPVRSDEPGFTFQLSDHEIDQIAIAYFQSLERGVQDAGGYRHGVNEDNRAEVLETHARDHANADAVDIADTANAPAHPDQDIRTAFHYTALRQLIDYNFVSRDEVETTVDGKGRQRGKKIMRLSLPPEMRDSPSFQKLADKLAQANAEIARRRLEANTEHREPSLLVTTLQPGLNTSANLHPHREHRLGELIDMYLKKRKVEVGVSRYNQLLIATRALEEELGRKALLSKITREQCQSLADLFVEVPPYASRHYAKKTLRQAAEAYAIQTGTKAQRHTEAAKHLEVLKQIFEEAVDKEWIAVNPAQRVKVVKPARPKRYADEDNGYEPFTIDELRIIFNQPLYRGCVDDENGVNKTGTNHPRRSRFWAPLISLFTGLRMAEILHLERNDVRELDGVHYINVNDRISGTDYSDGEYIKKLKTRNAVRNIPIHPELIRIGFLDHVAKSNREWLFPDLELGKATTLSGNFSKRFKTFMKPTGVSVPRRKVFHSFRNSFNDALRHADVPQELREPIMGWVDYSKMDNRYGSGHLLKRLNEQVERVRYDGLDLSHLYPENQR